MTRLGRRPLLATAAAAVVLVLIAIPADAWYGRLALRDQRARTAARLLPHAEALQGAVDRRVGVVVGLRSFVASRRTRAELDAEFEAYARGAVAGLDGVRSLEYFDEGRIAAIQPLEGNEAALAFEFRDNPDPEVRADYARSLGAVEPYVTGPVQLIEGGVGILMRLRLPDREGFPEVVGVILDAGSLFAAAGLQDPLSGLVLEVRAEDGITVAGTPIQAEAEPVEVPIEVGSWDWSLLGAPQEGWAAAIADRRLAFRANLAAGGIALLLLTWLVAARLRALARDADLSGDELDLALRAGRMSQWAIELATGRWDVPPELRAMVGDTPGDPRRAFDTALSRVAAEDRARLRERFEETRQGRRDAFLEEVRLTLTGRPVRHLLVSCRLERDADGRPARLAGLVCDVTARRGLEARVLEAQRLEAVGKLAGGVAHDFNNLLTAISGFADLARTRVLDTPGPAARAVAEDLAEIIAGTERGAGLTRQLLAFSRQAAAEAVPTDLSAAVAEMQPHLARVLTDRATVVTDLAAGVPPVTVDRALLTQVVINIVVHVCERLGPGATVTIRTGRAPADGGPPGASHVLLEVHGDGEIVEAESVGGGPRLTPGGGVRVLAGSRLGLAIVEDAVTQMGGTVTPVDTRSMDVRCQVLLPPAA